MNGGEHDGEKDDRHGRGDRDATAPPLAARKQVPGVQLAEQAPEQEPVGVRERAVERRADVSRVRAVPEDDPQRARGHEEPARHARDEPARRARAKQEDEQRGPDDVELLLRRERPRVRPVERGSSRLDDVRHVEGRREQEPPHQGLKAAVDPRIDREAGQQEHAERRKEPQRAPHVEPAQRDPAGALPLLEQERGDEESAEDEEDVDTDEPARHVALARRVECHDHQNRDAAEAVQAGTASEPTSHG
jgi:hypothetical protein